MPPATAQRQRSNRPIFSAVLAVLALTVVGVFGWFLAWFDEPPGILPRLHARYLEWQRSGQHPARLLALVEEKAMEARAGDAKSLDLLLIWTGSSNETLAELALHEIITLVHHDETVILEGLSRLCESRRECLIRGAVVLSLRSDPKANDGTSRVRRCTVAYQNWTKGTYCRGTFLSALSAGPSRIATRETHTPADPLSRVCGLEPQCDSLLFTLN